MEFDIKVWNWAKANNVKIWLSPSGNSYGTVKMVHGKKKKMSIPYVNICMSLDGNNKRFDKEEYKQDDEELPAIINKLYKYYYERANN